MARKLRLEFEGASYHVISRGNYRADVFGADTTKAAFMQCLGEASDKSGWVVHAWCVMSNHYHLCITTPRPNLVEGMQWLQATFSNRCNRLRNERGPLFQGRYKAPIIAPEVVGAVCHYIHLNPVRASVVTVSKLSGWAWTSLQALQTVSRRPRWFSPEAALAHAGGLRDTPVGRKRYVDYLGWLQEDDFGKKSLEFDRLSKDWAVGEKEFKKELLKAHRHLEGAVERGDAGPRELSMELWRERLDVLLTALKKDSRSIANDPKGAAWKVAMATSMKTTTTASNPWLAQALGMGSPFRLSRLVSSCRADPSPFQTPLKVIAKYKVCPLFSPPDFEIVFEGRRRDASRDMSLPPMIDFPAFSAGERHYSATDVIDAAWFRGEVQSCWETSMLGAARKQRADEEGLEPDSETLQHLSEDVRYRHDLITAEETEAWLTARGLTLDDLTGHAYRRYWREHSAAAPTPAGSVYIAGSPEERSVFLHDVIFDGEFAQLAEHLSWRAVGALVLEVPPTSGELEAARERFLQRTALRPEQLAPALGQLGRDAAWLGHMLALESAYERQCAQLCTAENRVRTLAALRLPLTSFSVELMDFDSADAVREACLCVSAADISMEELAGQEHRLIERRQLLLEDLPEDAQQQFLSAEPGHVLPFITQGERFQVCRIAEKREPALSDASVCARVDADLRTGHFGNLAAKHIVSAVAPPSAP